MRYAIVINGVADNIAEADTPLAINWVRSDVAGIGWLFKDGVLLPPPTPAEPPKPAEPPVYQIGNRTLTAAGQPVNVDRPIYYVTETQALVLTADMHVNGVKRNDSLPGIMGLPFVNANGGDVYLKTTLVDGTFTITGTLPSGSWKIIGDRVNRALAEINAPFRLDMPTYSFIVTRD